jgi:pimeloyl-ACP methyl ester carboxylesterase
MVDRARALLPGPVTAEVVDGAGHDVHLQEPARLTSMISAVLAGGTVSP